MPQAWNVLCPFHPNKSIKIEIREGTDAQGGEGDRGPSWGQLSGGREEVETARLPDPPTRASTPAVLEGLQSGTCSSVSLQPCPLSTPCHRTVFVAGGGGTSSRLARGGTGRPALLLLEGDRLPPVSHSDHPSSALLTLEWPRQAGRVTSAPAAESRTRGSWPGLALDLPVWLCAMPHAWAWGGLRPQGQPHRVPPSPTYGAQGRRQGAGVGGLCKGLPSLPSGHYSSAHPRTRTKRLEREGPSGSSASAPGGEPEEYL